MSKSVATKNDIQAVTSTTTSTLQYTNCTGSWTAGLIETKVYDYFTINGNAIAYEASCTFNFTGNDNVTGASVVEQETIRLDAKEKITTLQPAVLCNNDEASGLNGNKLRIISNNHLITD